MTNTIQVRSNFHGAGVFIINTRPDEIGAPPMLQVAQLMLAAQGQEDPSDSGVESPLILTMRSAPLPNEKGTS